MNPVTRDTIDRKARVWTVTLGPTASSPRLESDAARLRDDSGLDALPEPLGELVLGDFSGGERLERHRDLGISRFEGIAIEVAESLPTTTAAVRLFPSTNG